MYPAGHARNTTDNLTQLLSCKVNRFAALGVQDVSAFLQRTSGFREKTSQEIQELFDFELKC